MLVIFDWDGTLCDSTDKIVTCMREAAADLGLAVPEVEAVKNIIGLGLPEAIQTLFPGLESEGVEAMRQGYAHQYVVADAVPSTFFPGVEETLDALLSGGHQIAVATGKSRAGLNRVMAALGVQTLFHGSRCSDETASKPHPLMLHELLQEFATPVERAVMVGDTEFDMEMARRAGMARVAVDYGAHRISRLVPYEPVACLSLMTGLLPLVAEPD
ncbi:HAD-IA family hydrolase [Pseudomaricurvus sp. HS19]|uniref:HAD-IA family hydrolase n=1 Tax=Pseudomaricurvus sp. HS19 TaxID=2692626 RepID=UPI0013692E28|nr:HAD-IA family hydrolase [Pseudomaricurvus sp. HS19]MYM62209.1 HAD-IA family hydrolase [Pseudomaricurvus sp. HS19]